MQSLTVGDAQVHRPIVTEQWSYSESTLTAGVGPGAAVTSQSLQWHAGTLMPSEVTVTLPAVSTTHHGSGLAVTRRSYSDLQGRETWTQDGEGLLAYTKYDQGRVIQRIDDADTTVLPAGDVPAGWASTAGAFHRISTTTYDRAGEADQVYADGTGVLSQMTRLSDGRRVHLRVPYATAGGVTYGVTGVHVENHEGYDEATGSLATAGFASLDLSTLISTTQSDPLTAINTSAVSRWSTKLYGLGGTQVTESRDYFWIPATGEGVQGTHYDATTYSYNEAGEQESVTAPYGTITWDIYDGKGRITQRWVGTNAEGMDSGAPTGAGNMTMTGSYTYDFGSSGGNSLMTQEVRRVEDSSTDEMVTTHAYDVRGNLVGTIHPAAPHSLNQLDNLGRVVASATYDDLTNFAAAVSGGVTTETGRLSFYESFYDDRGQMDRSIRHKLDANGQSVDTLVSDMWYDDGGHSIKSHGARMSKTYYDRLGRKTHSFDLAEMEASVDNTGADSVAGNVVMQETQTVYESGLSDRVLMNVTIGRWPGDNGAGANLGALDSNADGSALTVTGTDIAGRYQINAHWYDALGRRIESVRLGNHDRQVFYRAGLSAPQRSDTVLRTSWEYNNDGTLLQAKSPNRVRTRYEYDQMGRTVKFTENYKDGVPNASYPDEDRITRYEYVNGLRTSYILEKPGGDLTTTYIYGTTKGAVPDSKIATGHLLARVSYPLASSGVQPESSFAYDVQERTFWKKDAAGTKRGYEFDDSGRLHKDIALELGTSVDGSVRMREYLYDVRGQMTDAIQYADTSGVTATDSTQFEFDDWGNTTKASTDPDSEMGGTGVAASDIDYGYEQAPLGRRVIRPTTTTYPSGEGYQFQYTGADYNNALSRPNSMVETSTSNLAATWDYLGWGQIVGMTYPDADISMTMLDAAGTALPSLDRFGRRTKLRWNRPLPSGNVTLLNQHYGYDWDSYLTSTDDKVMDGYDEELTIDGLGRIKTYERGAQTAGGFTDRTYRMEREFDILGNMTSITVDRNGDGLFTGTGESSETRTFNDAGEIVTRSSLDPAVGNPTWFADGAMDDNGEGQTSTYDAWGNLVRVELASTNDLILELRRDALNRIISQHADETGDGLATGIDTTYTYLPDGAGRALAAFKSGETTPRLERLFAGPESLTGSRESRDDDADGTRDRLTYVLPDATGSAAGFFDQSTGQMERVHYNPMGVPTCLPSGDINGDGKTDADDYVLLRDDVATQTYDDKSDLNSDGLVDVWDAADYEPKVGGTGVLSLTGNTLGLHQMPRVNESYLAGARTFSESLGRWTSKDPSGYVDGPSLYQGMRGNVFSFMDRSGMQSTTDVVTGNTRPFPRLGEGQEDRKSPGKTKYGVPKRDGGASVTVENPPSSDGEDNIRTTFIGSGNPSVGGQLMGCKLGSCSCTFEFSAALNIDPIGADPENPPGGLEKWHGSPAWGDYPKWDVSANEDGWAADGTVNNQGTGKLDGNSTPYVHFHKRMRCGTKSSITLTASSPPPASVSASISFTVECKDSVHCATGARYPTFSGAAPMRPIAHPRDEGIHVRGPSTPTDPPGTPQPGVCDEPMTPVGPAGTPNPSRPNEPATGTGPGTPGPSNPHDQPDETVDR
ncbi:MAG: hypothetical protein P1V35_10925 [Planctomycetota bacterium]|nr:hypothetical protein [Planctomycetota bacterium]